MSKRKESRMKTLITAKIVSDFALKGEKIFLIDDNTLITPSARDLARNKGISFVHKDEAHEMPSCSVTGGSCSCKTSGEAATNVDEIVERVIEILAEKGLLEEILK